MQTKLTAADRAALEWQLGDEATYTAWIERVEKQPNGAADIAQKLAACKQRMAASADKRPRIERDAELAPKAPTVLEQELHRARVYAQVTAELAAAKALGLKEAEGALEAEAAKLVS